MTVFWKADKCGKKSKIMLKTLKNQKLPRILKVAENLKICQKVAKQVTKHAVRPFPFHLAMNFEVSTKPFRPAVRVRFPTVYPIGPIQMYFNKKNCLQTSNALQSWARTIED